jgi:putative glycerol-1-phosphate prenyltransferase/phosphoglycerol geranylgeranyltransferase
MGPIEKKLNSLIQEKGALFIVLLDPDAEAPEKIVKSGVRAVEQGADVIFIGSSFNGSTQFSQIAAEVKKQTQAPVILFPGGASQVVPGPDAILFTTLISGRNPQYLIDEQVKGAVMVMAHKLEPIPTAYMLIESGHTTAVEYISNTKPIPADKPAIAAAHALAAQMMGQRWVYLEAGSGAGNPVPVPMVSMVTKSCSLNVIVGGGITSPETAAERVKAGAHAIVVGTAFEKEKDTDLFRAFSQAIHSK